MHTFLTSVAIFLGSIGLGLIIANIICVVDEMKDAFRATHPNQRRLFLTETLISLVFMCVGVLAIAGAWWLWQAWGVSFGVGGAISWMLFGLFITVFVGLGTLGADGAGRGLPFGIALGGMAMFLYGCWLLFEATFVDLFRALFQVFS
jgi:hypothetical protein